MMIFNPVIVATENIICCINMELQNIMQNTNNQIFYYF
jgi:hypothetical protein